MGPRIDGGFIRLRRSNIPQLGNQIAHADPCSFVSKKQYFSNLDFTVLNFLPLKSFSLSLDWLRLKSWKKLVESGFRTVHTATFVCLANSRKRSGRCLAGKAFDNGTYSKWIRPVTEHPTEELQSNEYCLQTGEDAKILDLLEIKLREPKGRLHQQENWLMDISVPLKKNGSLTLEEVSKLVDSPESLWGTGTSTKNGLNNCVPISEINNHASSLYLVDVSKFKVEIRISFGRREMRGSFSYGGHEYKLSITDTHFEQRFVDKPLGDYEIDRTLLTISLGEHYGGSFYKLIAGIVPIEFGKKWIRQ